MYNEGLVQYGIVKDFDKLGYFEAENHKRIMDGAKLAIRSGGLIAITGVIGSGKTTLMRKLQEEIRQEGKATISKSLSTEKRRVSINTLYTALFIDLAVEKDYKIPTQPEKRERELQKLIKAQKKPVVLFIDEAHELHGKTLISLKRLIEVVEDGNGTLAVVIIGHPALANDLKKPTMEEIGARAQVMPLHQSFSAKEKQKFMEWLIRKGSEEKKKLSDLMEQNAVDHMLERLATPLQIIYYLKQMINEAFHIGSPKVTIEVAQAVISTDIGSLEATLVRHGYNPIALSEQLNASRAELKDFFRGLLPANKMDLFKREILKLGVVPQGVVI